MDTPGGHIRITTGGTVTKIVMPNAMDGERLLVNVASGITVTLADDNTTDGGNIRLSSGTSLTLDSANDTVELMYRDGFNVWVPISEAAQR